MSGVKERRRLGRLACGSLSSTTTNEEIVTGDAILLSGRSLGASPGHLCALTSSTLENLKTPPNRILTPHLVLKLGVGAPLTPLFSGPSQSGLTLLRFKLSPNNYRLGIAIYILCMSIKAYPHPSMEELSHFA